jgi:uncharacterized membrane protein YjgN (DUF898 family)
LTGIPGKRIVPNHYQTLGLPDGASTEAARAAYDQALQYFLLRKQAGNPLPKEEFDALEAAYAELGDPARKAIYDQALATAASPSSSSSTSGAPQPESALESTPDMPSLTLDEPPPPPPPPAAAPQEAASDEPVTHRLKFVGSGSDYFRIWIVNLLLTIVTLGIYSAWAKVRREQYFHRNTLLDNSGFDYHGNPVAILKGRAIAWILLLGLWYVDQWQHEFYFYALLALLPLLPWLLVRSFAFRARNTSYRGLRFNFHGTYLGLCKILIGYALLVIAASWAMQFASERLWEEDVDSLMPLSSSWERRQVADLGKFAQKAQEENPAETGETPLSPEEETDAADEDDGDDWEDESGLDDEEIEPEDASAAEDDEAQGSAACKKPGPDAESEDDEAQDGTEEIKEVMGQFSKFMALFFLFILLIFLATPAFFRSFKRFQINHLSFGGSRFESHFGLGAIYGIFLRAILVPVAPLIGVVVASVIMALKPDSLALVGVMALVMVGCFVLFYFSLFVIQPYIQVRMTNLIWNNARVGEHLFASDQKFGAFFAIVFTNFLLTMLTLGLYWPWARVREFAYRVDHTLLTGASLDQFIGDSIQEQRAAGEEIAEAFDFDIAL